MEYTIKEAAKKLHISAPALRYYEKEGIIPNISKNESGHRIYTDLDLEMIAIVICLRKTGMKIATIKHFVKLSGMGKSSLKERIELFSEHEKEILSQIEELNKSLELVRYKIGRYTSKLQ